MTIGREANVGLIRLVPAILGALVIVLTSMPGVARATGQPITATLDPQMALRADGAGVEALVHMHCTRTEQLLIDVAVHQARSGGGLLIAENSVVGRCSTGFASTRVPIDGWTGPRFRPGVAAAVLQLRCSVPQDCSASSERTVSLSPALDLDLADATTLDDRGLEVSLRPEAASSDGGRTVTLRAALTCPAGHGTQVFAFPYLYQWSPDAGVVTDAAEDVDTSSCGPVPKLFRFVFRNNAPLFREGRAFLQVTTADMAAPPTAFGFQPQSTAWRQIWVSAGS